MAKIVIVDDEYFVRMGIKSIVQQKEKGYLVVGEAENGTSAVKLILEQQPDIVFLDITMPGMDGIQVLEKIRREGYRGYVAMLTCHEDFRLVQQAMRQGADDYVLKNELAGEPMLTYLDTVSVKLGERLAGTLGADIAAIERQEEEHFYKDNFLKNMLQIGGVSREEFVRGCARYHVRLHADGIYMITIYMNHWEEIAARYRDSDLQVLYKAVENMMAETFREYPEWEGFYSEPYCYQILFTCSREKSVQALEQKIRSIANNLSYHFLHILDIETVIAVYRNTYAIEELYKGYQYSRCLIEQRFFWPEQKLFFCGHQCIFQAADLAELDRRLSRRETEENLVEDIADYLAEQKGHFMDKREFFAVLSRNLIPLTQQYGMEFTLEEAEYENIGMLFEKLRDICARLAKEKENSSYSYLVKQAVQMIHREFQAKITLEEVSERLGISAGYFSRLFSGETGESFSNYVIRIRIEYACELITTTNYKFYEIAEMCGFSSPVHFNNTFKKLCNVTPNQYRKMH